MLALVMLLRGMLDPWNEIYYQLPFLVSLGAWEVCSGRRAPLFTLAASILVWLSFEPVNFTYTATSPTSSMPSGRSRRPC